MPVSKSAKKALRRDIHKTEVNSILKAKVRTAIKKLKTDKQPGLLDSVYQLVDRAAKRNILHKNKAARMKSRLTKWVQTLQGAEVKPAAAKKTAVKKVAAKKATAAPKSK